MIIKNYDTNYTPRGDFLMIILIFLVPISMVLTIEISGYYVLLVFLITLMMFIKRQDLVEKQQVLGCRNEKNLY